MQNKLNICHSFIVRAKATKQRRMIHMSDITMQVNSGYLKPTINENYVKLTGTVVHIYQVPEAPIIVTTIATSGSGGNHTHYPKVIWFGDLAEEFMQKVHEKDRISLLASVQTKRRVRTGEKPIYYQNIVGQGFTPALKKIESAFGLPTEQGQYVEDENDVRLAGTVTHVFKVPNKEIMVLTIRTYTAGYINTPHIRLFGNNVQYALENISDGVPVCATGYAYTNRVEREDGAIDYFEGLTCTSIAIAPAEKE